MGDTPIAVLQRLLDPKMCRPAEAFRCVRSIGGVLGGLEKDASFLASSSHAIVAGARFVESFGSLQSFQFGLV